MKFIALAFALACSQADAATIYISSCGTGSVPACIPGSDSNAGTDPVAPRLTIPTLAAGNTYRFARGSAQQLSAAIFVYLPGSSETAPTLFEDYTPTWCTGACLSQRPILSWPSSGLPSAGFSFADSGNADKDGWYSLKNLDLRGPGYSASGKGTGHTYDGIFVYNDADNITVDNVYINGFRNGVYVAGSNPINAGANTNSEFFTLKNSLISNNAGQGLLGGGAFMLVENNLFDNNSFGSAVFDHNIYISDVNSSFPSRGIVIRGNTLTRNANISGVCQSVALVAHAIAPDMIIENNTIIEPDAAGTCYGIAINSQTGSSSPNDHSRLVIRGNRVVMGGAAGQGIGCSACPDALIENNVVIRTSGSGGFTGISVPSYVRAAGSGDAVDVSPTIRNNSIYINSSSSSNDVAGIELSTSPKSEVISSNAIYFGPDSATSAKCFRFGAKAAGTFSAFVRNSCFRTGADARWSDAHSTLAAAVSSGFSSSNLSSNSMLSIPTSSNGYAIAATSAASPLVDAADQIHRSTVAFGGKTVSGQRDIGACEFRQGDPCSTNAPSVPSSPTGLR
jgi:hypothetical protein